MVKVRVISERAQRFGGLNLVFHSKEYEKILELCDKELGVRSSTGGGYSYSEVINALFLSVLSGGTCVEDINLLVPELSQSPYIKAPSADSVLRTLKKLSVEDELVKARGSGINYAFNRNSKLNELLVKGTIEIGLLERGKACDFDYDNQIIRTRKRDSAWTYKKDVMGYAPGIAFANGHPISIEGRGGNAPVIFDQARTLRLAYEALLKEGVKVKRSRMDAGSYSREVISVVEEYSDLFYIRAIDTPYHRSLVEESTSGWKLLRLRGSTGGMREVEARSVMADEFIRGRSYRVVLYRYNDGWSEGTMFSDDKEMKYRYFSIITNDWKSSEEEIIRYYNKRGSIERVFDQMNNDFNWAHLPSSDMNQNTVFMLFTALLRNFYTKYVSEVSKRSGRLISSKARLKKFIHHFVTCPARWVKSRTGDVLQLFGATALQRWYVKQMYDW